MISTWRSRHGCVAVFASAILQACAYNPPLWTKPATIHAERVSEHPQWMRDVIVAEPRGIEISTLHDGQQIIVPGTKSYGAFYGAVATQGPNTDVPVGSSLHVATVVVSDTGMMVPGTLFRRDTTCVILHHEESGYWADLHLGDNSCENLRPRYDSVPVTVVEYPELSDPLPPMVRWKAYESEPFMVLGAACGKRWCNIGVDREDEERLRGSARISTNGKDAPAMAEGWYDVQFLAFRDASGLRPSNLRASVYPSERLARLTPQQFDDKWRHVATIHLDQGSDFQMADGLRQYRFAWDLNWKYTRGLIPRRFDPGSEILVDLRSDVRNVAGRDTVIWSARYRQRRGLTFAQSPSHAVRFIEDDAADKAAIQQVGPLGSVRWGWRPEDESVWIRCGTGCCELSVRYGL